MSKITNINNLSICYPEIAAQWHPSKKGTLTPNIIAAGSTKKYWWHGVCGHEWDDSPNHRTQGRGCPFCRGLRVDSTNCLANILPEIAAQWHPSKNGTLTPYDATYASNKSAWWQCDKEPDHIWEAKIANRGCCNHGCAFCAGKQATLSNCLMTTHPKIAAQWHPTKNGTLTSYDVLYGSDKKVWWICPKRHEYYSSIGHRCISDAGCTICCESKGEKQVATILSKLGLSFKRQAKFKTCKHKNELPFDFMVKIADKRGLLIEYHGEQHYRPVRWNVTMSDDQMDAIFNGVQKRDKIKQAWAEKNNIPLLVIPYWKKENMTQIIEIFMKEVA